MLVDGESWYTGEEMGSDLKEVGKIQNILIVISLRENLRMTPARSLWRSVTNKRSDLAAGVCDGGKVGRGEDDERRKKKKRNVGSCVYKPWWGQEEDIVIKHVGNYWAWRQTKECKNAVAEGSAKSGSLAFLFGSRSGNMGPRCLSTTGLYVEGALVSFLRADQAYSEQLLSSGDLQERLGSARPTPVPSSTAPAHEPFCVSFPKT